ncbi:hypothetical protein N7495_000356 [Penicillium taxi]|uniref:uncharacterized protein n=1 Tax=Penicillium taxi TaxID=168475 RepID=UPI002544D537|nr:uncharacterized protein N7495_000356 [Penicillium taxi]KAJ5907674.1 hypothetical protein N7495_000356 [Penicillium taxi]
MKLTLLQHPTLPSGYLVRLSQAHSFQCHKSAQFSSSSQSNERLGRRAKEKQLDRVCDVKQYLSRFKANPSKPTSKPTNESPKEPTLESEPESLQSGVNLGSFYGASRAVYDSPVFRQDSTPAPHELDLPERLHLALIKIATPQSLDDQTIDGVAKTLTQLVRLGMACCVVIDPGSMDNVASLRQTAIEQANRISTAVDAQPDSRSLRLDSALSISDGVPGLPLITSRNDLLRPLRNGQVVIVTPIAYTEETPRAVPISGDDAVLALTKEFAGLSIRPDPDEDPATTAERISTLQKEVSLDRVILLHPLGGIPAIRYVQASHAFINMEQEFDGIEEELLEVQRSIEDDSATSKNIQGAISLLNSNPFSKFTNKEIASPLLEQSTQLPETVVLKPIVDSHLANLRLSQRALAMLPASASGIITSPQEVATSANTPQTSPSDVSAVGTRRQRNPLIHNLLTDKPLLSSSLPPGRRGATNGKLSSISQVATPTTFVKRGMPLTLLPNPRLQAWTAQSLPRLQLNGPSIDLPRLVHLIDDSFDRKLDVQDYLERVNDRIAGLIIAGEYEGGAILTWETPPGVIDDGSPESAARMVPYLDKFAVLKRSQGAGGVADVVFNAMVRTCFPNGVCWRSRKDNPVNKWYFERSCGSWKLNDSNWTMFWTTPGLPEDIQRFQDYEAVCRSIQPSWADKKSVID